MTKTAFWKEKSLDDMSKAEWESLCDGCGLCCLIKLEDEDTGDIAFTNVACEFLNCDSCQCTDYSNRFNNGSDCVNLTPEKVRTLPWLPPTCSYKLVDQGFDLPAWHHLVCGDKGAVHKSEISASGRVVSMAVIDDLEDHVTSWLAEEGADPFGRFEVALVQMGEDGEMIDVNPQDEQAS